MRDELLNHCECPVSLDIFTEATILQSGHTLDKLSVQSLINRGQTNPLTRAALTASDLKTPNLTLQEFIKQDGEFAIKDPITQEIITDPVVFIGSNGQSFDRATLESKNDAIKDYLIQQKLPVGSKPVTNFKLKDLIEEIKNLKIRTDLKDKFVEKKSTITTDKTPTVTLEYADQLYAANAFQEASAAYEQLKSNLSGQNLIHCLHRAGNLKAKLSKHEDALVNFKAALQLLSGESNYSLQKKSISNSDMSKYMQISLELSQAYRILASHKNPRANFESAVDICDKAYKLSGGANYPGDKAEELSLKFALLEEQIWAIKGLCDHEPPILNDNEKKQFQNKELAAQEVLGGFFRGFANYAPEMLLKTAQYYFLCQDHAEAIYYAKRGIQSDYESRLSKEDRVKLRLQFALSLSAVSKHEEAIESLQAALMLNPSHRATLKAKAEAHMKLGEFAKAVQCCDISLRLAPNDYPMLIAKARANFSLGEYEDVQMALVCLTSNDDVDAREKAYANSLLHQVQNALNPQQNVDEPSNLSVTEFAAKVKGSHNLQDPQTVANADAFKQKFLMHINNKDGELDRYLKDIFRATTNKQKLTGLELYRCVFMMKRTTVNATHREQYDTILNHISKIQTDMCESAAIMWNELTCLEYAKNFLKTFKSQTTPQDWPLLNAIKAMVSSNNGTPNQTPGGVVAQSKEMDSIANIHSQHLRKVAQMLNGSAFYTAEQKTWQENITQMLLQNPAFPNVHEYYLAFYVLKNKLASSDNKIEKDVKTVLDSIDQVEKQLFNSGAIDATQQTCLQYTMDNLHRATPKPGAKDPNAEPIKYEGSTGNGQFQLQEQPKTTSAPAYEYTPSPPYSR